MRVFVYDRDSNHGEVGTLTGEIASVNADRETGHRDDSTGLTRGADHPLRHGNELSLW
jgi:hypothetical protein